MQTICNFKKITSVIRIRILIKSSQECKEVLNHLYCR